MNTANYTPQQLHAIWLIEQVGHERILHTAHMADATEQSVWNRRLYDLGMGHARTNNVFVLTARKLRHSNPNKKTAWAMEIYVISKTGHTRTKYIQIVRQGYPKTLRRVMKVMHRMVRLFAQGFSHSQAVKVGWSREEDIESGDVDSAYYAGTEELDAFYDGYDFYRTQSILYCEDLTIAAGYDDIAS